MNILITGAAGYLGGAVADEARRRNHGTFCVDRRPYPMEHGFALDPTAAGRAYVQLDVLDLPARREEIYWDVDVVIHLAAIVGEAACRAAGERETLRTNVEGTRAAALALGVPVILASTCSVYGRREGVLTEEDKPAALELYARSKAEAELYARDAGQPVLRFGTLCGRAPRTRTDLIPNEWAVAAYQGRAIEVYEPEAWRPFCHVRTAAELLVSVAELAARRCLERGLLLNVVEENWTKGELAKLFGTRYGAEVRVVASKGDARSYQVSRAKMSSWSAQLPHVRRGTERAIREVYEWARTRGITGEEPELRNA